MHILFVTGEYPPMPGGVGAYTAELGRALVALGARVSVLTARRGAPQPETHSVDDHAVDVHPIIERWGWRTASRVDAWAAQRGVDWIHVQYQTAAFNMHPAINLAPQRWRNRGRNAGRRVAWTYHDLLVPYLFPKAGARLRRWITERPAHFCHLTIVTNAGDCRQLAARLPADAASPVVIPIGSNIQGRILTPDVRGHVRSGYGYSADELVLGYFGFLNRSKGGATLIRTLHRLVQQDVNAHLLMIGERVGASDPTNAAYLREIETLIHALGLSDRIQWTDHLSDADAGAALNACDVLFMPYEDGASLRRGTLMAGLANGCAIVTTTPRSPLPELVDGRDLLYVPAGDAEAAAGAILRLAHAPEWIAELQRNARARSQLFTWERIARQHLALYAREGEAS
jgi:glycosyltransferase involved in cell wall biosynthesis